MCNFPGGLFSRSLPTGAGDAGGSDDRGTGSGRCGSDFKQRRE